MPFLLDSNVWITYLRGRNAQVGDRIIKAPRPEELFLCSVVKAELLYGAIRSAVPQRNIQQLNVLFQNYPSLNFDDLSAQSYADIRTHVERLGTPIGPNDLMIAAIALANNLTLVTHNTREFSRIAGLQLEDWQSP